MTQRKKRKEKKRGRKEYNLVYGLAMVSLFIAIGVLAVAKEFFELNSGDFLVNFGTEILGVSMTIMYFELSLVRFFRR